MSSSRRRVYSALATFAMVAGLIATGPNTAAASSADHLVLTTSLSGDATAGEAFDLTVTAEDALNAVVPDYDGTVTFSGGGLDATLPADYTFQLTDLGTHTFSPGATLTEAGSQTIDVADDGTANGQAVVTVAPADADLSIVKTGPTEEFAGNTVGYTLSVHNGGPSTAATPSVTESFPSHVTNPRYCVAGSCSNETDFTAYTGPISLSDLASAGDVTIKVRADIPSNEPKDTVLHNSASVSSTTHDPNGSNNASGPIDTTVDTAADLGVTVNPNPNGSAGHDVIAGDPSNEVFKVDVFNGGPSDGGNYTLTLDVSRLGDPGGTTYVGAPVGCSPDDANNKVVCARTGIPAHTHDIFDVTVSISSSYVNPPNSATLTYRGTASDQVVTDPASPNDTTGNQNLTVIARADLGVAVTFEQEPPVHPGHDAVAGTNEIFHMKVTNYGYSDNRGFTATLTVPDYDATGNKLTLLSAPGCTPSPSDHKVTCISTATFSPGDKTYDVTFHISPSYTNPGTTKVLHYSATLSALTPTDQGTANGGQGSHLDSTGDKTLIVDSVADVSDVGDVSVTQTAEEQILASGAYQPLNPGNLNSVLYRVTVMNHGPSDAQNATLKETLPSTLQVGANQIKYCIDVSLTACTPTTPYATNGASISLGTLAPDEKAVVRFEARLIQSLRRGAAASYPSGNATAVATTDATDPDAGNNTSTLSIDLFTVPDAPTILQVQPGDKKIGALWQDPANGGSSITGYDLIANGTAYFVPVGSTTSLPGGKRTVIFPVSTNLTNGTTYTVRIEARNAAGDSDPSSALQATPCASCVVTQTTNAAITLLSSNGTAQVTTGTCFPRSNDVTKPGATTADPKVSCFQIPASVASAKAGSLVALRDEAPNPANGGDCPDPAHPCLGNQVSVAVPPGTGTNVQFTEVIVYDRTISTDVRGAPCTKTPCGSKYEYQVYMRPSIDVPAVLVGSTITSTWCKKNTTTGLYIIPSGKPGCVVEYRTVNTSTNPSDNGNTSNGKEGNGDLRLTVVFWGDPRTAP